MAALLLSAIFALVMILSIGAIGIAEERAATKAPPRPVVPTINGVPVFRLETLEGPRR